MSKMTEKEKLQKAVLALEITKSNIDYFVNNPKIIKTGKLAENTFRDFHKFIELTLYEIKEG